MCPCESYEAVDQDAMKAFFDKFDTDANGTISFEEWLGGRLYMALLGTLNPKP